MNPTRFQVVVSGGGTSAWIDDVRRVANVSTGRFSAAIAEACLTRQARVRHVHALSAVLPFERSAGFNLNATDPIAEHHRLESLRQTWLAVRDRLELVPLRQGDVADYERTLRDALTKSPVDLAFLAMAAADFEPTERLEGKIETPRDALTISFRTAPKVIRSVRDWAPEVFLVGFKLLSGRSETALIRAAEEACVVNRADVTLANDLRLLREGRHTVHLVRPGGPTETFDGPDLAENLVDRVFELARRRIAARAVSS